MHKIRIRKSQEEDFGCMQKPFTLEFDLVPAFISLFQLTVMSSKEESMIS